MSGRVVNDPIGGAADAGNEDRRIAHFERNILRDFVFRIDPQFAQGSEFDAVALVEEIVRRLTGLAELDGRRQLPSPPV